MLWGASHVVSLVRVLSHATYGLVRAGRLQGVSVLIILGVCVSVQRVLYYTHHTYLLSEDAPPPTHVCFDVISVMVV